MLLLINDFAFLHFDQILLKSDKTDTLLVYLMQEITQKTNPEVLALKYLPCRWRKENNIQNSLQRLETKQFIKLIRWKGIA